MPQLPAAALVPVVEDVEAANGLFSVCFYSSTSPTGQKPGRFLIWGVWTIWGYTHLPGRATEVKRGTDLGTRGPAVARLTVESEVPKSTPQHYR